MEKEYKKDIPIELQAKESRKPIGNSYGGFTSTTNNSDEKSYLHLLPTIWWVLLLLSAQEIASSNSKLELSWHVVQNLNSDLQSH